MIYNYQKINNMELKDLRKKIASKSINSCFMVECGNIYEFKIALIKAITSKLTQNI